MPPRSRSLLAGAAVLAVLAAGGGTFLATASYGETEPAASAAAPPPAVPVSVAVVERRPITRWSEFSGRLEAVDRVAVRSRVAGAVEAVHFREGALVKKGDLLVSIDPEPFKAEIERLKAQITASEARVAQAKRESDRGQELARKGSLAIAQSDVDQRLSAYLEAEAELAGARAALRSAELNLGYTEIRSPIDGRVGRLEVTVGNLVEAGAASPVLTTIVSVDPIYASFDADEDTVARVIKSLPGGVNAVEALERVPVEMTTTAGATASGRLQLIDNQVDAANGTVRVRAIVDNREANLIPGQFVRIRLGEAEPQPSLLISERAVGTDQSKRFVLVVGADKKAVYREVRLGPATEGLRVVTDGLQPGEQIVVNGLQRIRPGALVEPKVVSMAGEPPELAQR